MTTTTNLGITHVTATQNQKEVTLNTGLDQLDQKLGTIVVRSLNSVSTGVTMPASTCYNAGIEFVGSALTAVVTVVLPTNATMYTVRNSTLQDVQLQTSARTNASGCYITSNTFGIIQHDGTLVRAVTSSQGNLPYDIGGYYPAGCSVTGQVLTKFVFPRTVQFDPNMPSSKAGLTASATASCVFSIRKDGSEFATISFPAGGGVGTFAAGATTVFGAGSVLDVRTGSADGSAGGLFFTLAGRRL